MSLSRKDSSQNQDKLEQRQLPPEQPPVMTRQTSSYATLQREFAAQKHRPIDCMRFYADAAMALPDSAKSAHAVEKVTKKGKVLFFKHNTPGSLMSELEAAVWAIYHVVAPKHVPAKANAHFNSKNEYVGVSLQEIPDFQSTMDDPLAEKDLSDKSTVKGLAVILALSYILEEDDLHRGNMSKLGFRIDFDMSLWPVLGNFKEGTVIDWMYRPRDVERFCITTDDIDNFPDIKDAKPFYWPTIPQPIITEGARNVLSNFIPISRNAFPTIENLLFKKLKDNPDFIQEKFKTFLKFLLIDTDHYAMLINQHLRENLRNPDPHTQFKKISEIMVEHLEGRKKQLRDVLVKMPSFQSFLWSHGAAVKQEILAEFSEYNNGIREHEAAKRLKNPQRGEGVMFDTLIRLEDIKNNYTDIYREAKAYACAPMITQKL